MISIRMIVLLAFTVMQLEGMQKPSAKRRLFSEEGKDENSRPGMPSPTSGYKTETDLGTPVAQTKKLAESKIIDVSITNLSGRPSLVAYLGSHGQAHIILHDFNTSESKAEAHLSARMNLDKGEIYIGAMPEQFKIKLTEPSKRLLISKVHPPTAQEPGGFITMGDMPYPASGKLTIKIKKGVELAEPIILDMQ